LLRSRRRPPRRSPLFPYTTLFRSTIRFAEPPLNFNGSFNRINLSDLGGNTPGNPQVINLDDIVLHGDAGPDLIFANGFEGVGTRSEEHTSELQSRENLVCRLLLEK